LEALVRIVSSCRKQSRTGAIQAASHRSRRRATWPPTRARRHHRPLTWQAWREEIAFAEQFTRGHDLGFVGHDSEGEPISLRELLMHMIEEYARHNGHADLLSERIDGRVGQ
jgi:hypothetical protein